eukprot:COSAG06_NODE_268_length_18811_cov_4.369549_2_plen_1481_part_00
MRGAHGVIALLVAGGLSIDDGAHAVATALFERLREKLLRDGQDLRVVRAQRGWAYCGRILVALLLASRFGTGHGHEEDQPDSPAIPCSISADVLTSQDGACIFHLSADDNSALNLGLDVSTAMNFDLVATVPGSSANRQWNKYAEQQAAAVTLTTGTHNCFDVTADLTTSTGIPPTRFISDREARAQGWDMSLVLVAMWPGLRSGRLRQAPVAAWPINLVNPAIAEWLFAAAHLLLLTGLPILVLGTHLFGVAPDPDVVTVSRGGGAPKQSSFTSTIINGTGTWMIRAAWAVPVLFKIIDACSGMSIRRVTYTVATIVGICTSIQVMFNWPRQTTTRGLPNCGRGGSGRRQSKSKKNQNQNQNQTDRAKMSSPGLGLSLGVRLRASSLAALLVALDLASRFVSTEGSEQDAELVSHNCTLPQVLQAAAPDDLDICTARLASVGAVAEACAYVLFIWLNGSGYSGFAWKLKILLNLPVAFAIIIQSVTAVSIPVFGWECIVLGVLAMLLLENSVHRAARKVTGSIERPVTVLPWAHVVLHYINAMVSFAIIVWLFAATFQVFKGEFSMAYLLAPLALNAPLLLSLGDALRRRDFGTPKNIMRTQGIYMMFAFPALVDMFAYSLLHWANLKWETRPDLESTESEREANEKKIRWQRCTSCKNVALVLANLTLPISKVAIAIIGHWLFPETEMSVGSVSNSELEEPAAQGAGLYLLVIGFAFTALGSVALLKHACEPVGKFFLDDNDTSTRTSNGRHETEPILPADVTPKPNRGGGDCFWLAIIDCMSCIACTQEQSVLISDSDTLRKKLCDYRINKLDAQPHLYEEMYERIKARGGKQGFFERDIDRTNNMTVVNYVYRLAEGGQHAGEEEIRDVASMLGLTVTIINARSGSRMPYAPDLSAADSTALVPLQLLYTSRPHSESGHYEALVPCAEAERYVPAHVQDAVAAAKLKETLDHAEAALAAPAPAAAVQPAGSTGQKKESEPDEENNLLPDGGTFYSSSDENPDYKNDKRYFACDQLVSLEFIRRLCTCITCFNESADELDRCLQSLISMPLVNGCQHHILIVMDGWRLHENEKIPPTSTRVYLSRLCGFDLSWFEKTFEKLEQTTVITAAHRGAKSCSDIFAKLRSRPDITISIVVKKENQKKANSHAWFCKFTEELDAAAPVPMEATQDFLTDCGTVYNNACLEECLKFMDSNPHTKGICGTMRIMSLADQFGATLGEDGRHYVNVPTLATYVLIMMQTYSVDAQYPVLRAVWNQLGFLPVLCGAGVFLDHQHFVKVCHSYIAASEKPAIECDGVESNLKQAEDQILSYYMVYLLPGLASKTHWVRDAIFYYDAMTTLKGLVGQIKRWTNGGSAANTWRLRMIRLIHRSGHSKCMKMGTVCLLLLTQFNIVLMAFAPAIKIWLVWHLIYRISEQDELSDLVAQQDLVAELADQPTLDQSQCVSCESMPGAGVVDAWCMDDCDAMIDAYPNHCRCVY